MQTIEIEASKHQRGILHVGVVITQINFLMGRVLTIADASYPDKDQRKAAKDLIRAAFSTQLNHITNIALGGASNADSGQSEDKRGL